VSQAEKYPIGLGQRPVQSLGKKEIQVGLKISDKVRGGHCGGLSINMVTRALHFNTNL